MLMHVCPRILVKKGFFQIQWSAKLPRQSRCIKYESWSRPDSSGHTDRPWSIVQPTTIYDYAVYLFLLYEDVFPLLFDLDQSRLLIPSPRRRSPSPENAKADPRQPNVVLARVNRRGPHLH